MFHWNVIHAFTTLLVFVLCVFIWVVLIKITQNLGWDDLAESMDTGLAMIFMVVPAFIFSTWAATEFLYILGFSK